MRAPKERKQGNQHYQTIVIGAGISGLACASRILEASNGNKSRSVLVLEARDRIGGRIGSVHIDGNRLDTGANWIHGTGDDGTRNPILNYVPESGYRALKSSVAFRVPPTDATASTQEQNGDGLVVPADVSQALFTSFWQLLEFLHLRAAELSPEANRDTSILDAILRDKTFKDAFNNIPEKYYASLAGLPQMLEGMEAAPLDHQSAESREGAPGMSLLEFSTDGFDGDQVFLRDGYTSVVEKVAEELVAEELVKLNSPVTRIQWDQDVIHIVTEAKTYTAKNVVCTLPLGVLKAQDPNIILHPGNPSNKVEFSPSLPSDKLEAISKLGFGTLDKIFMVYQAAWWKEEPFISIIEKGLADMSGGGSQQDPIEPDSFRGFTHELSGIHIHPNEVRSGACGIFVVNLHALTGYPVLSAFVSCATARQIEAMPDAEARNIVHRALTSWFDGNEPPMPSKVHVTRWQQDPFSKGSYSHMITGLTEKKHRDTFTTPIINAHGATLRFAGEHTSLEDFATAHGALLSGWREADNILASGDRNITETVTSKK